MPTTHPTGPGDRPYPERFAGTDTIPQIKHIVILMMSGHSYDNYLGTSGRGDGLTLDSSGSPENFNVSPSGVAVRAHRKDSTLQKAGVPDDSRSSSRLQWSDGACDGFVRSISMTTPGGDITAAMGYWAPDDLPFINSLAQTFPVADRWFSSYLGPAIPNRRFLIAGTANGLSDELPTTSLDYPARGTIFDLLDRYGISWANYQSNMRPIWNLLPLPLRRLAAIVSRTINRAFTAIATPLLATMGTVRPRPMSILTLPKVAFTADVYPLSQYNARKNIRAIARFFADASTGTLPSVSFVDPDFTTNSGQTPQDVHSSESFTASVVNSLMHGPGWPHTLLIWLHDTWGGYYDHVAPPPAVPPDDIPDTTQLEGTGSYDRLGFRVPAVLVSPYARPDYVSSTVYDHTSILKLIERKWNLPPLTRRDLAAADPLEMIDLDSPPVFLTPPSLTPSASRRPGFRIDASSAFRIRSTRDLFSSLTSVAGAWGIGLLAFSGGSFWFQSIVLLLLTLLTIQGVRDSGFWRQWIFWRAPKIGGSVALYNAVFAFLTLSVFCALVSSELYRYGVFHIAESHLSGNILWMYTATYFWNLVDAIPGLEITGTLHWNSPIQFSNAWGELFLILFRLLVLGPLLTVIAEFISDSSKDAEPTSGKPVPPASRRRRRELMRRLPRG